MSTPWPVKKMRDIADVRVSNVDKKVYSSEWPVKLCNYMDVYSNDYIRSDIDFMAGSATPAEVERFGLRFGDVIITKDSESPDDIGIPAVISEEIEKLVCGYHLALIRPNQEEVDPVYLAKQISTSKIVRYFALQASGSTRFGLPIGAIEGAEIPTPPKPEQTKIAEVLSTVDRAIEQTEALIAKQQRIKTGLMQDLLTKGIDEHGNLRSEATHEFKDSPLGRIPLGWDTKQLSQLVDEEITYGIVQAGPHVDGGVPYIRTGDMAGDEINLETLLRTSLKVASSYKRSTVRVGDIVFALRASVGKVLPVTTELDGANLTQGTAKISPNESVDTTFLLWVMRTSQVVNAIRLEQKGTTFMEITLGDLRKVKVVLPTEKDEQLRIAEKLKQQNQLQQGYIWQSQKLTSLKTALMQDLLTGKKRVTPLLEMDTKD